MIISEIPENKENIFLKSIVTKHLELKKINADYLNLYLIADESGCIEYGLYNNNLNCGDIIEIENGYANVKENRLRVFNGKNGIVKRVGRFRMKFNLENNYSEINGKI